MHVKHDSFLHGDRYQSPSTEDVRPQSFVFSFSPWDTIWLRCVRPRGGALPQPKAALKSGGKAPLYGRNGAP